MKTRLNKLIALFVAVSLSASSFAYADDIVDVNDVQIATEEATEESSSTEATETAEASEETSESSVSDDSSVSIETASVGDVELSAVESKIESQFLDSESFVFDTDLNLDKAEVAAVLDNTANSLSSLEAGKDYISDEAFFAADSEESAKKVAEEYGAELASYSNHIAVLKFDKELSDVFASAAKDIKSDVLIHPNFINETDAITTGVVEDNNSGLAADLKDSSTHNDPLITKQWFLDAVHAEEAWAVTKGKGAKVCILDTGCEVDHEDLKANIVSTYNGVTGTTDVTDVEGHGTHCAGLVAAALDNGVGGTGVAPEASLYIVCINDNKTHQLSSSAIFRGLYQAAAWEVDVVSMSFGGYGYEQYPDYLAMYQNFINALHNNGTVCLAAAGNDGTKPLLATRPHYPSALDNVVSVASAGYGMLETYTSKGHTYSPSDPELSYYSNFGSTVDIVSPGGSATGSMPYSSVDDLSTVPYDYDDSYSTYVGEGYSYMAGTSMACPVAAGVTALIFAANPALIEKNTTNSAVVVENKLFNCLDGKTYRNYYSGGEVDSGCVNALTAVTGDAAADAVIVKRKDGTVLTNNTTAFIEKGASEKFTLFDGNGKKLKGAVSKSATWASSNANFAMKNGSVKVSKSASEGDYSTISLSCNGTSMYVKLVAIEKVKKVLYQKTARKVSNSFKGKMNVGSTVDMSSLTELIGQPVYAVTSTKKYGRVIHYSGYNVNVIGYNIVPNKKAASMLTGSLFTPTKKGSYKFKYVLNDGSKKAFTVTIKAV